MPRPGTFPKDKQGTYLTLPILKEMKNGNLVNIFHVQTDVMALTIPADVIQDGENSNWNDFLQKIYFKDTKSVIVGYFFKETGQQSSIILRNVKDVSKHNFLSNNYHNVCCIHFYS